MQQIVVLRPVGSGTAKPARGQGTGRYFRRRQRPVYCRGNRLQGGMLRLRAVNIAASGAPGPDNGPIAPGHQGNGLRIPRVHA